VGRRVPALEAVDLHAVPWDEALRRAALAQGLRQKSR
jgi:hypothetical protein